MPILWRYVLVQFFKGFFLCTGAFIGILLTMRLDEITHFATLGPHFSYLLWFILYQIPYILPIAIPIAGLISTLLLMQRLSQQNELTALRASGMAFRHVLTPIFLAATLLAVTNFYIVSELATTSHLATGMLKNQLRSINPLLLASNKHLMRLQGYYFDTLGASKTGEFASDVIFALPDKGLNKNKGRISLLLAKHIDVGISSIHLQQIALITSRPHTQEPTSPSFDALMIENIEETDMGIQDFFDLVQKHVWKLNNDHLQLSLLLLKLQEEKAKANLLSSQGQGAHEELQLADQSVKEIYLELMRRISLALAAFTFTLMGAAYGITVFHRGKVKKRLFSIISLVLLALVGYFVAQGVDRYLLLASLLYLIPHPIIVGCSLLRLRRAAYGIMP